jgi:hypothetical protein
LWAAAGAASARSPPASSASLPRSAGLTAAWNLTWLQGRIVGTAIAPGDGFAGPRQVGAGILSDRAGKITLKADNRLREMYHRRGDGGGCSVNGGGVKARGSRAGLDEAAEYSVDMPGVCDDGEDVHGRAAACADHGALAVCCANSCRLRDRPRTSSRAVR